MLASTSVRGWITDKGECTPFKKQSPRVTGIRQAAQHGTESLRTVGKAAKSERVVVCVIVTACVD